MPELTPEQEQFHKQEAAGAEFYKEATERGQKFDMPETPSDAHAKRVEQMIPKSQAAELRGETPPAELSDKAQEYILRLQNSKSPTESTAILNEVLGATQSGKLPPDQANEVYANLNPEH